MAPSTDSLEDALRSSVEEVYQSEDRNNLTVRFIRDKVENGLGLDQGFFLKPEWKDKSKHIIKSWATKLIDDDELRSGGLAVIEIKPKVETKPSPIKESESPTKKGTKWGSQETKKPPKKRQKKEETPSEDVISEAPREESVISDFKDSEDSDSPKVKKKVNVKPRARGKPPSRKRSAIESDESESNHSNLSSFIDSDEDSDVKPEPPKKAKKQPGKRSRPSKSKVESDEESEDEHVNTKVSPTKAKTQQVISNKIESADEKSTIKVGYFDSDSEAAMMIDEDPKPKQKRRSKSEASSSKAPKSKAAPKELSPDEAQIKTLQSQLIKCGVRKIWGIVLKKFGDDNKQKIRHLQGMLRDVGMTGRFSDQRAREIKELRELQADLEAVQQGDSMWGLKSGGKPQVPWTSLKESSNESGFDETDRKTNVKAESVAKTEDKASRVKQELAFLGDESDSD